LALSIIQHATYSLYRLSYLGSFRLPNNVTFFEEYKLQSPSLEFSCIFLPTSYAETFLEAPRLQTLLYKTAAESESEYLKRRLYVNTVMAPKNILAISRGTAHLFLFRRWNVALITCKDLGRRMKVDV